MLAVDAVPATVAEAVAAGAGLLITHHPLLLTGVHGVPADDPKGGLVHRMIRSGVAHLVAHTNADVADPGVSDALAMLLGRHRARAAGADPGPAAGQAGRLRAPRGAGGAGRRAGRGRRRPPRRLRPLRLVDRRHRHVPAAGRSEPGHRRGGRHRAGGRVAGRDGGAAAPPGGGDSRAAGRALLRGARLRPAAHGAAARHPRLGTGRRAAATDHAGGVRRPRRRGPAAHRVGRAGGRRSGPPGPPCRGLRRLRGRVRRARPRRGSRRLPDRRSEAPPGRRGGHRTRRRRHGPRRRRALGHRGALARRPGHPAARPVRHYGGRPGVAHRHRPLDAAPIRTIPPTTGSTVSP